MSFVLLAYQEKPANVHFKNQEEGETVLLLLRQHMVTNLPWVALVIAALLFPFLFLAFTGGIGLSLNNLIPQSFQTFIFLAFYMIVLAFAFLSFMNWFFNVDLVTDHRIVDINYWGFLFFRVSSTTIVNIQDVTYSISGGAGVIFNYGNVKIQTAGEEPNFMFERIPNPDKVQRLLVSIMRHSSVEGGLSG
ncbi:MAG: PH domain-containing protein [Patescibacteria group bacterium]